MIYSFRHPKRIAQKKKHELYGPAVKALADSIDEEVFRSVMSSFDVTGMPVDANNNPLNYKGQRVDGAGQPLKKSEHISMMDQDHYKALDDGDFTKLTVAERLRRIAKKHNVQVVN